MSPIIAPDIAPNLGMDKAPALAQGRSKPKSVSGLMLFAIVVLLVVGIWRVLARRGDGEGKVMVVAAGKDLLPGCRLGFQSLHYTQMPRAYVTSDMVTNTSRIAGCIAKTYIPMGEPILSSMLFPYRDGLHRMLENDERAITLAMSDDALVDHTICPGDFVDVIVTVTKQGKKYSRTLCQCVRVLMSMPREAALSRTSRTQDANKITLAVLPEQCEKLSEAVEIGKLRLVLRNHLARAIVALNGADERDLLPAQALITEGSSSTLMPAARSALVPPPMPADGTKTLDPVGWLVEVFSGAHKETYAFPPDAR